jgi:hypothetical protein
LSTRCPLAVILLLFMLPGCGNPGPRGATAKPQAPAAVVDVVLVRPALDLLGNTDPVLLEESSFIPEHLDELAFDPRALDHFHPINKRPNVLFGETPAPAR